MSRTILGRSALKVGKGRAGILDYVESYQADPAIREQEARHCYQARTSLLRERLSSHAVSRPPWATASPIRTKKPIQQFGF